MTKEEFIGKYRKTGALKILLNAFDDGLFLYRSDLEITERYIPISKFGDFYCPWYSFNNQEKSFWEGLGDINVKAIRVKDSALIDLDKERKSIIEKYQKERKTLEPFPIATGINANKTLLLDSNKTCIALYRNFLASKSNFEIPVAEIKGRNLESVIGDFLIVNRPYNQKKTVFE